MQDLEIMNTEGRERERDRRRQKVRKSLFQWSNITLYVGIDPQPHTDGQRV